MSGLAKHPHSCARVATGSFALLLLCAVEGSADAWPVVTPEELAAARPVVDPQADAEALFWETRIVDSFSGKALTTEIRQHVRIKVFTERGKQSQSRIDLPYVRGSRIDEVSARTVALDGKVTELGRQDIGDRVIVKSGGVKVRAKSFLVPGVEVGSIVEYRWREFRSSGHGLSGAFLLQRDVPCRRVTYRISPVRVSGWNLRYQSFNSVPTPFTRDSEGYEVIALERMAAFVEEADMPPELEVRAWIMIYYEPPDEPSTDQFWNIYARALGDIDRDIAESGRRLKSSAARITGEAATPDEQIRRLYEFCRTQIQNLEDDASGLTDEQRDKLKAHKNASQTLEERRGTWYDINRLFAALASSLGFRAQTALLGNRELIFFHRRREQVGFLTSPRVAIQVGGTWRFYDPGATYVPPGMLRWQQEDQDALVCVDNSALWLETPLSRADSSRIVRTGNFRLDLEGTLEGDARVEFYGHCAMDRKEFHDDLAPADREKAVRTAFEEREPGAVVDSIRFEHVTDPSRPLTMSYHVRIPGFAQLTGKRLFFQPAVFQHGMAPRFPSTTRRHPVYFHYLWTERDSLTIDLPEGYELDHPDTPANHTVEQLLEYAVNIATMNQERTVVYRRFFGLRGLHYRAKFYDQVKAGFDAFHERDQHALAVRQISASSSAR